jgi:hypothetical protein
VTTCTTKFAASQELASANVLGAASPIVAADWPWLSLWDSILLAMQTIRVAARLIGDVTPCSVARVVTPSDVRSITEDSRDESRIVSHD